MLAKQKRAAALDRSLLGRAVVDSFWKLDPRVQLHNPVMFVVYVGSIFTTILLIHSLVGQGEAPPAFIFGVSLWLWITVLFANFAEAVAEWRGKAQAEALRKTRQEVHAKRLREPRVDAPFEMMPSSQLHKDDIVLVREES
jgi:K+-transporting ATPase ATPase B chain